jgi:hypothetical protein
MIRLGPDGPDEGRDAPGLRGQRVGGTLRALLPLLVVPVGLLPRLAAAALAGIALALALDVALLVRLPLLAGLLALLALLLLLTLGHANPFRACRRMPACAGVSAENAVKPGACGRVDDRYT